MKSSKTALIATIIVFLLAVGAAVFAIIYASDGEPADDGTEPPPSDALDISPELQAEAEAAAGQLIVNNHTLVTLFITQGLTKSVTEEAYGGNPPEDGINYVLSEKYKTFEDIEAIVRATFVPEEAERFLNNCLDENCLHDACVDQNCPDKKYPHSNCYHSGRRYYNDYLDKVYYDRNGRLGINMNFEPETDYPVNWKNNVPFDLVFVTLESAKLSVKLEVNGTEAVFERMMTKVGDRWYLDRFLHDSAG